uniref:Uncharacterized protein n=1 Tax=Panagrolaimus sp. JU765 TaxID=591449 RepID=A0AC34RSP5_9BILA
MRKQAASAIAIVMCRESDGKPFYGFGYHRFLLKFPLDTIQPSKDKFPVLFSMINEKQRSYEIWKPKIDDFLSFSHQTVISEGKTKCLVEKEKGIEMTFFCNHIEWQLFLVLCFERKVPEKESAVQNFLSDVVGFLRFSKLYQELRTPPKSGNS